MMSEWLCINGRMVDPSRGVDEIRPLGIRNGYFCNPEQLASDAKVLDCTGKILCPGFVDLHVHLREPGQEYKETIASGTAAALAGGLTTVLAMPNTLPAVDSLENLRQVEARLARDARVHVLQSVCLTAGRSGNQVADLAAVAAEKGNWYFSDDGSTPQEESVMEEAMALAAKWDSLVIDHCECKALVQGGVMHQGAVARQLGCPGQTRQVEETVVARDIALAKKTGCRLHLQHLSSAGSVDMVRQARQEGLPVTGEVTPHHLCLTDEACLRWGTLAKMAPPLREESDRQALIAGLRDGTLTAIASDHAPHTLEEKKLGWQKAPFGIVSMEVEAALALTELLENQGFSLLQAVALFTDGPRRILRRNVGTLEDGAVADVTILEQKEFRICPEKFVSLGRNTPYEGMRCLYRPWAVFLSGEYHRLQENLG